ETDGCGEPFELANKVERCDALVLGAAHFAVLHSVGRTLREGTRPPLSRKMSARMSSARQAVVRAPSFTAAGYRPALTPAHQVLRETGKWARIVGSRTK